MLYQMRYNIVKKGEDNMPKFIPKKPEKEVISMRISVDTRREVDQRAVEFGISRNELINQMIDYALANMGDVSVEA